MPSESEWLRPLHELREEAELAGRFLGSRELDLAESALVAHPGSVRLWILRGDFMQLSDGEDKRSLVAARASYEKARELDSDDPEPWESLA